MIFYLTSEVIYFTYNKNNNYNQYPKVSIFLPIYNKANFLKRSIGSVQNQTLKNIEIVAINDCSTDNSLKILKKLSKFDKRIKIINNDRNHGLLYSRAMGLLNSTGEYLINLDPDDMLSDFFNLELLYNNAKKENTDLIVFRLKKIYPHNNSSFNIKNKSYNLFSCEKTNQKWQKHNLITNKFVKKSLFLKAYNSFKSRIFGNKWNYGEDNIWSRLINKLSNSTIYINKFIYCK
jgi:glycosyltransferase involved in cell wall biosynthesis